MDKSLMGAPHIPPEHRAAFVHLTKLTAEDVGNVVAGFDAAQKESYDLGAALRTAIGDVPDVFEALLSFTIWRTGRALSAGSAMGDLLDSVGRDAGDTDITPILGHPALALVAKTLDLSAANQRVMQRPRIISDIRPIFDDDWDEPSPIGSRIIHQLQVGVLDDDGRFREYFFAMDSDDLRTLKLQVDRAILKNSRLESLVGDWGIPTSPLLGADE